MEQRSSNTIELIGLVNSTRDFFAFCRHLRQVAWQGTIMTSQAGTGTIVPVSHLGIFARNTRSFVPLAQLTYSWKPLRLVDMCRPAY